jgi:hypothetical protein
MTITSPFVKGDRRGILMETQKNCGNLRDEKNAGSVFAVRNDPGEIEIEETGTVVRLPFVRGE